MGKTYDNVLSADEHAGECPLGGCSQNALCAVCLTKLLKKHYTEIKLCYVGPPAGHRIPYWVMGEEEEEEEEEDEGPRLSEEPIYDWKSSEPSVLGVAAAVVAASVIVGGIAVTGLYYATVGMVEKKLMNRWWSRIMRKEK